MKDLKELIKENQKQTINISTVAYLKGVTDCVSQLFNHLHGLAETLQINYINHRNIIKKSDIVSEINDISTVVDTIRTIVTSNTKLKEIKNEDLSINHYVDDMIIYVTEHGINNLSNKLDKLVDITDVNIDELV